MSSHTYPQTYHMLRLTQNTVMTMLQYDNHY